MTRIFQEPGKRLKSRWAAACPIPQRDQTPLEGRVGSRVEKTKTFDPEAGGGESQVVIPWTKNGGIRVLSPDEEF